jgi:hypothetical protein
MSMSMTSWEQRRNAASIDISLWGRLVGRAFVLQAPYVCDKGPSFDLFNLLFPKENSSHFPYGEQSLNNAYVNGAKVPPTARTTLSLHHPCNSLFYSETHE